MTVPFACGNAMQARAGTFTTQNACSGKFVLFSSAKEGRKELFTAT
jgi:hypothetical protein